jgi:hypothetical protein
MKKTVYMAELSFGKLQLSNEHMIRRLICVDTFCRKKTCFSTNYLADVEKFQPLFLVHQQSLVTLLAPNVPKEEKSRMEKEALDQMCGLLGGGPRGKYQNTKM